MILADFGMFWKGCFQLEKKSWFLVIYKYRRTRVIEGQGNTSTNSSHGDSESLTRSGGGSTTVLEELHRCHWQYNYS